MCCAPLDDPRVGLFLFQEPLPHIPVFCRIDVAKALFCTLGFVPLVIGKAFPLVCSEASAPFVIALNLVNRPLEV